MYCNAYKVFALVVVLMCANCVNCASSQRTNDQQQPNCELVRAFFETRNITVSSQAEGKHGDVCSGACCNQSTEESLRLQVQRDFSRMLRHNSRSLQGLLDTTASTLQDHVLSLTRQSENKTLVLFSQVYRRMAVLSQEPISALYADIRQYIQLNGNQDSFTVSPIDIKSSVIKFFTDLFPLVYHHNINTQHSRDFTAPYKVCLRETINEIQPFGDIPKQISQSLFKSLEATRLLLQAFNVGAEVLNTTESLLTDEGNKQECHKALLKMSYCPKCLGLSKEAKPCSGYCLNVLHGCLTRHVSDLDSAWNGYVEAIERLVIAWKQHNNEAGVNVDAVIRGLDTRISEAIMYAMENTPELEKRVKKACGLPKLSDKEDMDVTTTDDSSTTNGKTTKPQRYNVSMRDNPPPETQLLHFLTSIAKSRGFYTNLADNLCKDDSFAETKDQNCWNGKRIGEYTETVVDPSLGMQKYNPEVNFTSISQNGDQKIANLADKLRHVHNMVITTLGSVNLPESDSFMQGDAAEGSGSGRMPDDDETMTGSGSGEGTDDPRPNMGSERGGSIVEQVPTKPGSSSNNVSSSATLVLLLLLSVVHVYRCSG